VNPVGGGGLIYGMISGRIAGEVAGEVISKGASIEGLKRYDTMWKHRFFSYLMRCYRLKSYAYSSDRNMELVFKVMRPLSLILNAWPSLVGKRINPGLL